jgi:hypothetical protein
MNKGGGGGITRLLLWPQYNLPQVVEEMQKRVLTDEN